MSGLGAIKCGGWTPHSWCDCASYSTKQHGVWMCTLHSCHQWSCVAENYFAAAEGTHAAAVLRPRQFHLALKVVRGAVFLAGQLQALIDENLIHLALPEQASKVLRLLVAALTGHKCQLVKLEPISPASSAACSGTPYTPSSTRVPPTEKVCA